MGDLFQEALNHSSLNYQSTENTKSDFLFSFIFNRSRRLKMAVHPGVAETPNESEFPQARTKNGAPILEGEIDAPFLWAGASRPVRNEFVSSAKSSLLLTTND